MKPLPPVRPAQAAAGAHQLGARGTTPPIEKGIQRAEDLVEAGGAARVGGGPLLVLRLQPVQRLPGEVLPRILKAGISVIHVDRDQHGPPQGAPGVGPVPGFSRAGGPDAARRQ